MLGERGQRLLNRGKNVMVRPVQLLSQYSLAGKAPDYVEINGTWVGILI